VREFVSVWNKVMNLDRYDLAAAEKRSPTRIRVMNRRCVPVGSAHLPLDTSDPPALSNCHPERSRGIWVCFHSPRFPDHSITGLLRCSSNYQIAQSQNYQFAHSLPPPPLRYLKDLVHGIPCNNRAHREPENRPSKLLNSKYREFVGDFLLSAYSLPSQVALTRCPPSPSYR